MARKYEVVETGTRPHRHYRPGPVRRWLKGIRTGGIVRCECGTYFKWGQRGYGYDHSWTRINEWEYEKHGIMEIKKNEK